MVSDVLWGLSHLLLLRSELNSLNVLSFKTPQKVLFTWSIKVIILFTTKAFSFFFFFFFIWEYRKWKKKTKPAVEENCSQEQKSKLLCYDENISGAIVEYAFLSENGAVESETILMLWKRCVEIICIYSSSRGGIQRRSQPEVVWMDLEARWSRQPNGELSSQSALCFWSTGGTVQERKVKVDIHMPFWRQSLALHPTSPHPFSFLPGKMSQLLGKQAQCVWLANYNV